MYSKGLHVQRKQRGHMLLHKGILVLIPNGKVEPSFHCDNIQGAHLAVGMLGLTAKI